MVEIFLVVSNSLVIGSILVYFYFREIKKKEDDNIRIDKIDEIYARLVDKISNISISKDALLKEVSQSKDSLFQKSFLEYLKHIEKLEKMVLPKPVTRQMVQEVLDRTPNEIEEEKEEPEEDIMDVLNKIPITKDTKVAFSGQVGERMDNGLQEEIIP